jgi:hypothetical protein
MPTNPPHRPSDVPPESLRALAAEWRRQAATHRQDAEMRGSVVSSAYARALEQAAVDIISLIR